MKLITVLLLVSLPLGPRAAAAAAAELNWLSWNQAMAEAASTGRPLLIDVYTDWCGWCKRMDKDVYARDDVREYLKRKFIPVKLNAESAEEVRVGEQTMTARALAQQLRVSGYPTTIFLKPNGRDQIARVPGYIPAERFGLMMRYIGEDHIGRGVSWQEFEKSAAGGRIRP
jgi:thioredoxin-related protein